MSSHPGQMRAVSTIKKTTPSPPFSPSSSLRKSASLHLYVDLVLFDAERPTPQRRSVDGSHKRKQLIGVFSGALVNARLDRVIGFDVVRKLLNMVESKGLEQLRQDCLYIDVQDGRAVTPREHIGSDCARLLTVFAGEVMAEGLGHFPWDLERMLDTVIAFERSIGMPEKKIERG